MNKKLTIFFDVQELYYLPQYLPVYKQLQKEDVFESKFIFHHGKFDDVIKKIIEDESLNREFIIKSGHKMSDCKSLACSCKLPFYVLSRAPSNKFKNKRLRTFAKAR